MIKILVCGGRDFANVPINSNGNGANTKHPNYLKRFKERTFVLKSLYDWAKENEHWHKGEYPGPEGITVITGGAKGVDTAAIEWAMTNFLPFKEYPANWDAHGKSAGHIRNKEMLDKENPDIIIAFPGGKGTENMVTQARKRGFKIKRIKYEA